MAKLPDIEYGGAVPSAEDAPLREGDALQRATGVIAEGLTRYGMEVVKTRTARASATLAAGLTELETQIASRRYVSAKDLRDALGADFDSLPASVKSKLTEKTLDAATGELVDMDRAQIPTWEVWGPVFDARAKRLLEAAGKDIPGAWRGAFEAKATDEVVLRKLRVNELQARAMDADLRLEQGQVVDDLARAGSFDQALAVIHSSDVFTTAEKAKASEAVLKAKQQQPVFDAIQLKDVGSMRELRAKLALNGPDSPFGALNEHERTTLATELDTRIRLIGTGAQARVEVEKALKAAGGDPTKALAGIRANPNLDPDLAEESEKWLVQRVHNDEAMRKASDSPHVAVLESAIDQGKPWSRASDEYLALSKEGKAVVDGHARAAARSNRAEGSQERREQAEADRQALYTFQGLPLRGEDGKDQRSINVDQDPLFQDVSPVGRARIKAAQRKSLEAVQKDGGVSRQVFLDKVAKTSQALGYKAGRRGGTPGRADLFRSSMLEQYDAWQVEHPEAPFPPPTEVNRWVSEAVPEGDDGGIFSSEKPAFEARTKGESWTRSKKQRAAVQTLLNELGGAPAPAAPAPAAQAAGPSQADRDRVQALWRAKSPGRPPLTDAQVLRYLESEKAGQ